MITTSAMPETAMHATYSHPSPAVALVLSYGNSERQGNARDRSRVRALLFRVLDLFSSAAYLAPYLSRIGCVAL